MFERLTDRNLKPSEDSILEYLGQARELWLNLNERIEGYSNLASEFKFFTKEHGWSKRYFRGSRTFCRLFPEAGAFSLLVVLGNEEAARIEAIRKSIAPRVYGIFNSTEQLRDGRWLWVRIQDMREMESCAAILSAKAGGVNE